MKKLNYEETPEFQRDLKKLLRKYKTLLEDLKVVKTAAIELYHLKNIDNQSVFRLQHIGTDEFQVYKVKKFACKSLKGRGSRSGMRLIYGYVKKEDKVVFLEIYFKGDKENEDQGKIQAYMVFHP